MPSPFYDQFRPPQTLRDVADRLVREHAPLSSDQDILHDLKQAIDEALELLNRSDFMQVREVLRNAQARLDETI